MICSTKKAANTVLVDPVLFYYIPFEITVKKDKTSQKEPGNPVNAHDPELLLANIDNKIREEISDYETDQEDKISKSLTRKIM